MSATALPVPLAFGTLAIGTTVVLVIVVAVAINIVRTRGHQNSTFLEWDPVDRTAWRRENDDADVHLMLSEHNRRRAERGLDPQTMDEYTERAKRG